MKPKTVNKDAFDVLSFQSDRSAKIFVWSVWLIMMLVAFFCLFKYSRNIPLAEDWFLVPPLTGNEPNLTNWLWALNNEDLIPLPRFIMLVLLKITHGDFRVGMIFNITMLGILASAMIIIARSVRGGRTSFVDAFFPIALLHLGNWENLFWNWQLSFVLPTVLSCTVLIVLVTHRILDAPNAAVLVGLCLVLLPLCGLYGVLYVPLLALWLRYCGVLYWRAEKIKGGRQWVGKFLTGSALVALCLTGLYLVRYERPSWTPPNPGVWPSLEATLQFLALGFGPVARSSWWISMAAAIGVLLTSGVVVILAVLKSKGLERHRALGLLVFFMSITVFALAIGWSQAGLIIMYPSWPIRYVLLSVPTLFTAFFIWELYSPTKLRTAVQYGFFIGMCLLIPFNTIHGFWWRDWYRGGTDALLQDIKAGDSAYTLAKGHRNFLFHSMEPSQIANLIQMLHEAGMGPFGRIHEVSVNFKDSITSAMLKQAVSLKAQEIRYHLPGAGEVFLVWGINGWNTVPQEIRPAGTEVKNKIMQTPMALERKTFVAKIRVPAGSTINYGFLITKSRDGVDMNKPVWDGQQDYHVIMAEDAVVDVKTVLVFPQD